MIASGDWKTANFKPYNFEALGIQPPTGHLHPLLKVRAEYRQIFLEMGFSEMPTNNFVESSFWNFDALFQPQQHPARDAHDTFFIRYVLKRHFKFLFSILIFRKFRFFRIFYNKNIFAFI